ncbi:uncharacterized protein [Nicotiana tomentosiformis]|uniref:uncharacterized protein n=1 Tax=Nicotiana tomentosiformis TaxID=4098 RepID=UPI00051B891B|nr:uncharacterized protein LOC104084620 [Nicotiana tomentosiformis]
MVSRVEEAMKIRQQQKKQEVKYQVQKQMIMQCNKGKTNKFKRSSSNVEEDGASAAILLLACIACTTYRNHIN